MDTRAWRCGVVCRGDGVQVSGPWFSWHQGAVVACHEKKTSWHARLYCVINPRHLESIVSAPTRRVSVLKAQADKKKNGIDRSFFPVNEAPCVVHPRFARGCCRPTDWTLTSTLRQRPVLCHHAVLWRRTDIVLCDVTCYVRRAWGCPGLGAPRNGSRRQPSVEGDVLQAGRPFAGPVHGGQLTLRRLGLLGWHRACKGERLGGWGEGRGGPKTSK